MGPPPCPACPRCAAGRPAPPCPALHCPALRCLALHWQPGPESSWAWPQQAAIFQLLPSPAAARSGGRAAAGERYGAVGNAPCLQAGALEEQPQLQVVPSPGQRPGTGGGGAAVAGGRQAGPAQPAAPAASPAARHAQKRSLPPARADPHSSAAAALPSPTPAKRFCVAGPGGMVLASPGPGEQPLRGGGGGPGGGQRRGSGGPAEQHPPGGVVPYSPPQPPAGAAADPAANSVSAWEQGGRQRR